MEKWIAQLHKHAWYILDTLKVTSVYKLDSSMKVSPSSVWELALSCIKEPFSQVGCEPYFPVLKPHREVPYPNYMEMSLLSVSMGGVLTSWVAEPRRSPVRSWSIHENFCSLWRCYVAPQPSLCAEMLSDGKRRLIWDSDYQLPVQAGYQSVQLPYDKARVL